VCRVSARRLCPVTIACLRTRTGWGRRGSIMAERLVFLFLLVVSRSALTAGLGRVFRTCR